MKKKPKLEDYGIDKLEYSIFVESERKRAEKCETSKILYIFLHTQLWWLLHILVMFIAELFSIAMLKTSINFKYLCDRVFYNNFTIGKIIGFTIGYILLSILSYRIKMKSIDNQADLILNDFSEKKIKMLNKYYKDLSTFEDFILNKEMEQKILLQEIEELKHEIKTINNNSLSLQTDELKNLVKNIYVDYEFFSEDMFDFSKGKQLIKCVGNESFIAKVEIEQMLEYMAEKNYKSIKIFLFTDEDCELYCFNKNIEVVNKGEIIDAYLSKLMETIEKKKQNIDYKYFGAQYEKDKFWYYFDKYLETKNAPFMVCHTKGGKNQAAGNINNDNPMAMKTICCEFKYREQVVVVQVYINNDISLYDNLYSKKNDIEKELGYNVEWIGSGERSCTVRKIQKVFEFNWVTNYEQIVEIVYPYILDYIRVFSKYLSN